VLIHLNHYLDQSDLLRALDLESGVNARLRLLYWVTGLVSTVAIVSWIVVLAVNMDVVHYNIMISVYFGFEALLLIFTTVRLNTKMRQIDDQTSTARHKFLIYQIILCLLVTGNFFWVLFIPDIRKALIKDISFVGTTFLLWLNLVFELPILLVVCSSHQSTFSIQDTLQTKIEQSAALTNETLNSNSTHLLTKKMQEFEGKSEKSQRIATKEITDSDLMLDGHDLYTNNMEFSGKDLDVSRDIISSRDSEFQL
jgi:hypothetical protein